MGLPTWRKRYTRQRVKRDNGNTVCSKSYGGLTSAKVEPGFQVSRVTESEMNRQCFKQFQPRERKSYNNPLGHVLKCETTSLLSLIFFKK